MGLDQYAYVATRANQNSDWWDGADLVQASKFTGMDGTVVAQSQYQSC
jgi:hypothetical protein